MTDYVPTQHSDEEQPAARAVTENQGSAAPATAQDESTAQQASGRAEEAPQLTWAHAFARG